jgi:hypothetical protein
MTRINILIDEKVHQQLIDEKWAKKVTLSQLIRDIIDEHLTGDKIVINTYDNATLNKHLSDPQFRRFIPSDEEIQT